jgi:hypothetical protein
MSESEKIVRRDITMYGHPSKDDHGAKCDSCEKLENLVKPAAQSDPIIRYSSVDIYTPPGQQFASENKVEEMPVTKDCKTTESGKEDCRIVRGYDEKDWTDLLPKPKVEENKTTETVV